MLDDPGLLLSELYMYSRTCIPTALINQACNFKVSILTKASINSTAELHKACLCYCKNISKSYSMVFKNHKENNTLEKNGNLSSYSDRISHCLNRLFPLARGGRKWASRKEWGRSSHTFEQCCFSSHDAQR